MSLVLTGRNETRLDAVSHQIRRAAPGVKVELVAADLSTRAGVSALLDHVGNRPIEVLVNNAGFGNYGPFAEADPDREADEVAVDVSAVVALARAFLPGMLARGSGGILNVASTIAFQPAPYQAVYGASKAFVLSFSQVLWAEARAAGVAVTALCPGPTRTGFIDALGANVGHTAIYRRLGAPEPVIEAGPRALDKGRAVVIPGLRNKGLAASGRFMPREWLTRVAARLLRPVSTASRHRSRSAMRSSFLLRPDASGSCSGAAHRDLCRVGRCHCLRERPLAAARALRDRSGHARRDTRDSRLHRQDTDTGLAPSISRCST